MRVSEKVNVYAGKDVSVKAEKEMLQEKRNGEKTNKELKSVSANSLAIQLEDEVLAKKVQTRKEAMKIVMDQFGKDDETDQEVKKLQERNKDIDGAVLECMNEIDKIKENKENAAKEYDIDLSEYESGNIKENGNAEFDNIMKDFNDQEQFLNDKINEFKKEKNENSSYIGAVSTARLKSSPMLDAKKTAEELTDAASKEIIGILINESKDRIDEEREDKEEEVEEIKEEQEEAKKEAGSSLVQEDHVVESLSNIKKANTLQKKFEDEINSLLNNKKVLEEDLKGINLDEQK